MNKCKVCGKDSGKGNTCGATCRSRFARSVANATVDPDATVSNATVDATLTLPVNFGQPDCQCQHCRNNRAGGSKHIINHGKWKAYAELGANELNRVSPPFDVDYNGVCLDSKYDSHRIDTKVSETAVSGRTQEKGSNDA